MIRTPEEELLKDQCLASIGVRLPASLRKSFPGAFRQPAASIITQGKAAFRQKCGFTQEQVSSLVEQHADTITSSADRVAELFRVVDDMFKCAGDMERLADVMLSSRIRGFCTYAPADMQLNLSYYCTCVGASDKAMERAWLHGVFTLPPANLKLDMRLQLAHGCRGCTAGCCHR